jgi:hypothetical protein
MRTRRQPPSLYPDQVSIDDALRARVHRLVTAYVGADGMPADLGAEPAAIRCGTAIVYLRLVPTDRPVLRVFSPLLRKVECSTGLLRELNDLNAKINFLRVFWRDGTVFAAAELLAAGLGATELSNACDWVSDCADYYDVRLHARFGGELAFTPAPGSAHPADAPAT